MHILHQQKKQQKKNKKSQKYNKKKKRLGTYKVTVFKYLINE